MDLGKNSPHRLLTDVADSAKKSLDSAVQAMKDIGTSIEPIKDEVLRMGRNGLHTVEDVGIAGADLVIKGGEIIADKAKIMANNPKIVAETAKFAATKSKDALIQAKDFAVDKYDRRSEIIDDAKTFVSDTAGSAMEKAKYVANNPMETGHAAFQHANEIGKGLMRGGVASLRDLSGHLQVGRDDIERLLDRIKLQSAEYSELTGTPLSSVEPAMNSSAYLDAILVGGDSLHSALALKIPADILKAYEMHMPILSQTESFREYVQGLTTETQKRLFVSKMKGKLFEIQYTDDLNDGLLPDGYHAEIASRANEPGWDIRIFGPDGSVTEYLQLKATASVSYIQNALDKYPGIHVVSTSEVHSEIVLLGMQHKVTNSDISVEDLTEHADHAVDVADADYDASSVFALALIAFTSYKQTSLTPQERSRLMGDRTGTYAVAYLAGLGADAATGGAVTFASMIAATASRVVIGSGRLKFEKLDTMQQLINGNEVVLDKLRQQRRPPLFLSLD